jgi:tetratricopeptide (TPR) repeat protein
MPNEALSEFQRALLINPGYLTARNNLGVALLGQSRLDYAAGEFQRVLAEDPRNLDAIINLALVDKAAGRPERAKESLLRALVIDPENAPAHFNLASLYEQSGESSLAIEHYRAFLEHAGAEHASRASDARARLEALKPHSLTADASAAAPDRSRTRRLVQCAVMSEIDALLKEDRRFPPSADWTAHATAGDPKIYERAAADPAAFWASFARELDWMKPWDDVVRWKSPDAQWFAGGKLNASANCVDRHAKSDQPQPRRDHLGG